MKVDPIASFSFAAHPPSDGGGDFESKKGLSNDVLGLPKEDIDERTRAAIAMAEEGSRMTRSTA